LLVFGKMCSDRPAKSLLAYSFYGFEIGRRTSTKAESVVRFLLSSCVAYRVSASSTRHISSGNSGVRQIHSKLSLDCQASLSQLSLLASPIAARQTHLLNPHSRNTGQVLTILSAPRILLRTSIPALSRKRDRSNGVIAESRERMLCYLRCWRMDRVDIRLLYSWDSGQHAIMERETRAVGRRVMELQTWVLGVERRLTTVHACSLWQAGRQITQQLSTI
jgi:hypothetical protein